MSVLHEMLEIGRRRARRKDAKGRTGRMPTLHQVEGRAVTVREMAKELGISHQALERSMKTSNCSLEEAVRRHRQRKGKAGPKPKYRFNGRTASIREIAKETGIRNTTLGYYMRKHHCGLEEAVMHYMQRRQDRDYRRDEEQRRAKAVDEIMGIIMEG